MELYKKLKHISCVITDVDGILTDGRVGYGCNHEEDELKFFDVKDGLGIKLLAREGISTCVLSGRSSRANRTRFKELGISSFYENVQDKTEALHTLVNDQHVSLQQCAYLGDDLMDIKVMKQVEVGATVADAAPEVIQAADFRTAKQGGKGALRELAEEILKAQDRWNDIVQSYVA